MMWASRVIFGAVGSGCKILGSAAVHISFGVNFRVQALGGFFQMILHYLFCSFTWSVPRPYWIRGFDTSQGYRIQANVFTKLVFIYPITLVSITYKITLLQHVSVCILCICSIVKINACRRGCLRLCLILYIRSYECSGVARERAKPPKPVLPLKPWYNFDWEKFAWWQQTNLCMPDRPPPHPPQPPPIRNKQCRTARWKHDLCMEYVLASAFSFM